MSAPVPDEIFEALAGDAVVVTPNERAARSVRLAWDQRQRALGRSSWESAAAFSWRTWLDSLWRDALLQGASDQLLLSSEQEHLLWCLILRDDPQTQALRSLDELAALCAQSYRRIHEYNGVERWEGIRPTLSGDAASFARWLARFEDRCRRDRLLPRAALPFYLARCMRGGTYVAKGQQILLLGFDTLLPSQKTLLDMLTTDKRAVTVLSSAPPSDDGLLVEAQDRAAELSGFARWAREQLIAQPERRIALIVANLATEREEIESVLRETLSPELEGIFRSGDAPPFELSLGRPLYVEPLIRAALDLLHWAHGPLPMEQLERLLLGPALGNFPAERTARAALDREIRRELNLLPQATMAEVVALAEQKTRLSYPLADLRKELRAVTRLVSGTPLGMRQSFSAWAEYVRFILAAARWAEQLDSRSYQLRERWEQMLEIFARLDFAGQSVSWSEASETLLRLARQTIFAPQSHDAPVQVMGPSEAAGSEFDAVWILHTAEMDWPPAKGMPPLLPVSFARSLGMPGTDRELDRSMDHVVSLRLAGSAPQVIFSYAGRAGSGTVQRPSSDLAGLGLRTLPMDAVAPLSPERPVIALERFVDSSPLPPLPSAAVRGGVRVLELQAQCPFRAFAELRLCAEELRTPAFGLSPAESGSAAHTALEELWRALSSQKSLRESSEEQRAVFVENAADLALRRMQRRGDNAWAGPYLELQRRRLSRLLSSWLNHELLRPDFIVSRQETWQNGTVGPLELSLRVDRIDLVDGRQVLLDYKTGVASPSQWLGERPDFPQLPLYAVLTDAAAKRETAARAEAGLSPAPPLGAVAFATFAAGQRMGIQGFESDDAHLLPVKDRRPRMDAGSFAEQVELWAEVLERLATEFANGNASVAPKQFPKSCRHCGQRVLCRVDPANFGELADQEDGERTPDE